jgi:SAM-dependent methyltransferase
LKVHNVRSPEQWEIISRHVDFKGKTVLDLGCGKGDILFRAFEAGAKAVGIDKDQGNIEYLCDVYPEVTALCDDIERIWLIPPTDIIICFSVLPYLHALGYVLKMINRYSDIALIECQYAGDGPGLSFLKGNNDMRTWLLEAGQFEKVQVIGHTFVEGRDKNRFIWMCE